MRDKVCTKCGMNKTSEHFTACKRNKNGLASWCKKCTSIASLKWQQRKRIEDPIYLEKTRIKRAACNRNKYAKDADFRVLKKQDDLRRQKERYAKDVEYRAKRNKASSTRRQIRRIEDPLFATRIRIRNLISQSIRRSGFNKKSKAEEILGICFADFIERLNLMSITKYGYTFDFKIMDIDHIIPMHTASSEEEVLKLNHYSNLQPLLKDEHKIKTKNDIKEFYANK